MTTVGKNRTPGKAWTKADIAKLVKAYPDTATDELAERMGRSLASIRNQAIKLGLRKSPEYHLVRGGTFKPGHKAWNKGKPHPAARSEGAMRGWFKKGQLNGQAARNYKRMGSLRVKDDLLERKVSDRGPIRWVPIHRLVWEAANGPVPAGHVVVFRQGRRTLEESEITIDRLELISRAENMRRNSYHTRYPKEVAQLIQLRGALNRQINKRTKQA